MKKLFAVIVMAVSFSGTAYISTYSPEVSAHPKPGTVRFAKGCKRFARPKKRRACRRCFARPGKHHYHPRRWTGKRCMRNGVKAFFRKR